MAGCFKAAKLQRWRECVNINNLNGYDNFSLACAVGTLAQVASPVLYRRTLRPCCCDVAEEDSERLQGGIPERGCIEHLALSIIFSHRSTANSSEVGTGGGEDIRISSIGSSFCGYLRRPQIRIIGSSGKRYSPS